MAMTTYHDVPADLLIGELSARLSEVDSINPPEWSKIVKTGTHRERHTQNPYTSERTQRGTRKAALPILKMTPAQDLNQDKHRKCKKYFVKKLIYFEGFRPNGHHH